MVRNGAERAEISAEFDVAPGSALEAWLQASDYDTEACLLRRVIDSAGRSRAYINGAAASGSIQYSIRRTAIRSLAGTSQPIPETWSWNGK